jgi:hypothetical protein
VPPQPDLETPERCPACGQKLTVEGVATLDEMVREWRLGVYPMQFGPYTLSNLNARGYYTVGDLIDRGRDVMNVPGIGPSTYDGITEMLGHVREFARQRMHVS